MRDKPLILLVDDELNFLEIIGKKLAASGYDVITAQSGAEAIDLAQKRLPDLILMDIAMPDGTGTDAALIIKQNPATRNLKIAFLSNMKDPWPRTSATPHSLAKEIGFEKFIDKAADLDTITAEVEAVLAPKP
jgi:CheY-like chemotaxis protein